MRKNIYCSGWGAISELVPKLSSVGAALPRHCPQSSECKSSHRLCLTSFRTDFMIVKFSLEFLHFETDF
ncbi:hypothetical protein [Leptospira borgpetersenii]|uniref:hypothetical protein n=1 Tax=Leptospira borgpetersenii TaxID=174 RepID=UPI000B068EEB|nr:hypothetical protein [Leptospira borgpetersenii]